MSASTHADCDAGLKSANSLAIFTTVMVVTPARHFSEQRFGGWTRKLPDPALHRCWLSQRAGPESERPREVPWLPEVGSQRIPARCPRSGVHQGLSGGFRNIRVIVVLEKRLAEREPDPRRSRDRHGCQISQFESTTPRSAFGSGYPASVIRRSVHRTRAPMATRRAYASRYSPCTLNATRRVPLRRA